MYSRNKSQIVFLMLILVQPWTEWLNQMKWRKSERKRKTKQQQQLQ